MHLNTRSASACRLVLLYCRIAFGWYFSVATDGNREDKWAVLILLIMNKPVHFAKCRRKKSDIDITPLS